MKTLELREFKATMQNENGVVQEALVSYKDLIQGALNYIPSNQFGQSMGLPVDEIRLRIRVLDKLDNDKKEITLDDEDVKVIFECVKAQKFIRVDQGLIDYFDYIKELHESEGE